MEKIKVKFKVGNSKRHKGQMVDQMIARLPDGEELYSERDAWFGEYGNYLDLKQDIITQALLKGIPAESLKFPKFRLAGVYC